MKANIQALLDSEAASSPLTLLGEDQNDVLMIPCEQTNGGWKRSGSEVDCSPHAVHAVV